jgi:hypothetical protein
MITCPVNYAMPIITIYYPLKHSTFAIMDTYKCLYGKDVFYDTVSNIIFIGQNYKYERVQSLYELEIISNSTEIEFNNLFNKWQEETKFQSSSEMFQNPCYQNIIKLGENVIPYIIKALKKTPAHLFVALHRITGTNPIKPENRGRINEMANDWIDWWESKDNVTSKFS